LKIWTLFCWALSGEMFPTVGICGFPAELRPLQVADPPFRFCWKITQPIMRSAVIKVYLKCCFLRLFLQLARTPPHSFVASLLWLPLDGQEGSISSHRRGIDEMIYLISPFLFLDITPSSRMFTVKSECCKSRWLASSASPPSWNWNWTAATDSRRPLSKTSRTAKKNWVIFGHGMPGVPPLGGQHQQRGKFQLSIRMKSNFNWNFLWQGRRSEGQEQVAGQRHAGPSTPLRFGCGFLRPGPDVVADGKTLSAFLRMGIRWIDSSRNWAILKR